MLATAVTDNLVVAVDPDAPASGLYYWEISRPWRDKVVDAVRACTDPTIRTLGEGLLAEPTDHRRYWELHAALLERQGKQPEIDELLHLGWRAECNSRLGHVLNKGYDRDSTPVTVEEMKAFDPGTPLPAGAKPEVLVVIPFHSRLEGGGDRLRNLLACLRSLRDQSFPREHYQVTVVESDEQSRWRDVISPFADNYLFARKDGVFNKSWAMNAGVVHSPGPTEIICHMDADVLADRDFLARNVERMLGPGTMGHLPYRDMLAMDFPSTWRAIRERLHGGAAAADMNRVRGFTLRRGPGLCFFARAELYHRVGGMDERYQGWGGEDIEFNYRFGFDAAYDAYEEPLLHMRHPSYSVLRSDGKLINAHLVPGTWRPERPIGQLDQFTPVGV
ncbi:glycosyltransferase [Micromonospora sp. WMMD1102]|uniref:glycosyltransferase n=1 Tax=Micromonospora sp. WMMD1102 TaxID=3016105 RepID=UPI002414EBEF|nr:glycosyltransferase [Micromonospora sp. WMMD1102]MDG4785128.1 glycosyltransferase [Micromonospora sp. WMMD1102]